MDAPESQPGSPSGSQPGSLPGCIYLLAYDLDRRQLFDRTRTAFLTRAAVLIELAWRGRLDADGHPAATGPAPPATWSWTGRWPGSGRIAAAGNACSGEITGRRWTWWSSSSSRRA